MAAAESRSSRQHPAVVGLAILLGLLTVWLSIGVVGDEADGGARGTGLYAPDDAALVKRVLAEMTSALVAMQREDGSFDPSEDVGVESRQQQVAADALATAALVEVRSLGSRYDVPYLADAVDLGLNWLRGQQIAGGRVAPDAPGPEGRYHQVDATAAALLAFVTAADASSVDAAKKAGPALVEFADDGLRAGWSRALAAMTVDRVYATHRQSIFPREARARQVVRGRKVGERRDHHDMAVSEAIVRLVIRRRSSVADAYPQEILTACLDNPPRWQNRVSDMQLWWMQAWVVSHAPREATAWFHDLVIALDDEALGEDGRVPGGYYATALVQTSAAILAVIQGLKAGPG